MKRLSLLLLILSLTALLSGLAISAAAFQAQRKEPPLKLNQIERLLDLKFEDNLLAAEISQRGIAFRFELANSSIEFPFKTNKRSTY